MIRVRAPNGNIIQFPDGTSSAQINSVMASYHDAATAAQKAEAVPGTLALRNGQMFNHAPDVDGALAAAKTGLANLVGRGPGYGMADAYKATKAAESGVIGKYNTQHPWLGTAANVIGGVANPLSLLGGEYVGAAKGLLPAMGRAALVGAAEGGAAGGAPGAVTGAVLGPVAPVAGSAASHVGGIIGGIARNAQRAAGMANPDNVATRRIAAAVAKDIKAGVDPRANLANWPGASTPALVDVAGENTRALVRDAGTQGPARTTLRNYRDQVAANLQPNAQTLTRALTPTDTRTVPQISAAIDRDLATASTPPVQVAPGTGGAALSDALNQRAEQAWSGVNQAYDAVRNSDARVTAPSIVQLPGRIRQSLASEGISTDLIPSLNPGTRAALGEIDRLSGNIGSAANAATPNAAASLESGIPVGAQGSAPELSLADIERVRRGLNNRLPSAQGDDQIALRVAKREFDGWLNDAMDNGGITGDQTGVDLLRAARQARANYGRQFEAGDLINTLTNNGPERNGALTVAPEDASGVLFGNGAGVTAKPNVARDFARVTDLLGADHPAVQAVQNEAASRLLAQDAGTPAYGSAFHQFQAQNPAAAGALLPDLSDHLGDAQSQISNALARRQALDAGLKALTMGPDSYVAAAGDLGAAAPEAQVGARAALMDTIGAPQQGATAALNRIATASNKGGTLSATFGDDAANAYRSGIAAEAARDENADWLAPNLGPKTFTSAQDAASHGGAGHLNPIALLGGVFKRVANGPPLSDAERSAIVLPAIGDVSDEYLRSLLAAPKPYAGLFGSQYGVAPVAITAGTAAGSGP